MLPLSRRRRIPHEDIVAEQYAMLRRAALHLAHGDDAEAGDLLHDMCVRFLLLRPDLERIDHIDGYLFRMLRNVYLSRQRRQGRRNALVTDAVDVDLLAAMVDQPEPSERLRMRDDLLLLVAHACERTRVSRGASAWVLRCLHGYYPTEIAHVMKMPPRGVDRALHVARREALEELRRPSRRLLARLRGGRRWRDRLLDATDPLDTLHALRARVFASVDGPCLTDEQLAELHRPESDDPVGPLVMAHIVACADCLDRINRHLGLSPLSVRDPVESSGTRRRRGGGTDSDGDGGNAAGGGTDQDQDGSESAAGRRGPAGGATRRVRESAGAGGGGLDPLLRRTRDTIASIVDHVPQELRITANGFELGAQPVTGTVTVQELAVRLAESLAFIEIFDERGALVCYWPAQVPNEDSWDDHATIELAAGRRLELQVSRADDCPRLHVRYTDERAPALLGDGVSPRVARRVPSRTALADAAPDLPWWSWIVPPRRVATAFAVLLVLWMIFIGPTTTWAAFTHLGRAAASAIRMLIAPRPEPSRPAAPVPAPPASPAPVLTPPHAGPGPLRFSPSELAEIEMTARVRLHEVKADLGDDITLIAASTGVIVKGVVPSAARRDVIARALADLDGVRVLVRTVRDVAGRPPSNGTRTNDTVGPSAQVRRRDDPTPVRVEVPASARAIPEGAAVPHVPDPADRRALVNAALADADAALTRAWALRRLAERYPPREVAGLSRRSSQALASLVDDHAAALRAAVDALVVRVAPLLDAAGTLESAPRESGGADTSGEARLSIMQVFALVHASHAEAYALLARAKDATTTPADPSDALLPTARTLLSRLRHLQQAVSRRDFGHETLALP